MAFSRKERAVLLVAVALFFLLGSLAYLHPYFAWDLSLTQHIQSIRSQSVDFMMIGISWLGYSRISSTAAFLTGVVVLFLIPLETRKWWSIVFWTGLGTGAAVTGLVKAIVMRPRPTGHLACVLMSSSGWSFPSGHAVFFTQYFGFLGFLLSLLAGRRLPRALIYFFSGLPVILAGVSRVYVGAHWPSDVAGGYLAGLILLHLMIKWYRHRTGKNKRLG